MPPMFDLIASINSARRTYEALVSVRGARVSGGEIEALLADAHSRFKELGTAMGYMVETVDYVAQDAVEGRRVAE